MARCESCRIIGRLPFFYVGLRSFAAFTGREAVTFGERTTTHRQFREATVTTFFEPRDAGPFDFDVLAAVPLGVPDEPVWGCCLGTWTR